MEGRFLYFYFLENIEEVYHRNEVDYERSDSYVFCIEIFMHLQVYTSDPSSSLR